MTRLTLLLASAFLVACNGDPGVVIEEPDREGEEFLTVMERFDTTYVGRWHENGSCTRGDVLELADDRVSYGDTTCNAAALSKGTARVRMSLSQCSVEGVSAPDRTYVLDIAGENVLYLEGTTLPRTRLERCPG